MNRSKITIVAIACLLISLNSCFFSSACAHKSILENFYDKTSNVYKIKSDIDLKGNVIVLAKNSTIEFEENTCIKNGTLVGNATKLAGVKVSIFDNVDIKGDWRVPYISSKYFRKVEETNNLKSAFALLSNNFHNILIVEDGVYNVSSSYEYDKILRVPSNSEVIINGIITLEPNNYGSYDILCVQGSNIYLHGEGKIMGDKICHKGTTGEWGMGINIYKSNSVKVEGLTVMDCWGDCIYIGHSSSYVNISNCLLNNGRRQGLSITSGVNINVENVVITNVSGTNPEYAIDLEPNKGEKVKNVVIKNVIALNCKGGFLCYGDVKNTELTDIKFYRCEVLGDIPKESFNMEKVKYVEILDCESNNKPVSINDIFVKNADSVRVSRTK